MASEYGLEILVTPIVDSAAAAAMGSKTAQSFNQGFERSLSKQPLGRITGQASEFQKSIEASNARVIAFGASAGSIYLVKVALDKLVSSTVQVEKGLANINVILGLGQTALRSFSNEMFKAAANTGQTFETASKVALEFARHGVSATETVKRMTSAMELMRISGLSAEDSVNSITAAINAFNKEGLTSEDIVNRLTAVDTKFAVSAQDLAESIRRVGATAEDAGVRFNELLGFVTAAQTVTARGGAVIGNAFKSIFTRLARPQVLDDLEAVGVATRTTSGQILPMVTILKGLASTYDSLSYSQKSFITQAVGGVYQVNILKASLADLGNGMSIFDKASIAASQSAGLIDKRMSSLNETLSSKVNASMLEITKLFSNFGNIAFGSSAKSGVDNFNQQLASISDKLEDIKPDDSIGERMGKTLGQGISRGIGDILSGPVVQMVAALGTKAMITLGSFAQKSGKEFLGKNSDAEKLAYIQKDITKFIKENKDAQALFNSELDKSVEISKLYLQTLSKGRIFDEKSKNVSRSVANIVQGSMSATPITRASGYVPSFAAHQEVSQARALGAPASVQAQWGRGTIGGQSFVMNNRELEIPHFGTNGDSAVLPTYSRGFVPNFSNILWHGSNIDFNPNDIRGRSNNLISLTHNFSHAAQYAEPRLSATQGFGATPRDLGGFVAGFKLNKNAKIFDATKLSSFAPLIKSGLIKNGSYLPFDNYFGDTEKIQEEETLNAILSQGYNTILQRQADTGLYGGMLPKKKRISNTAGGYRINLPPEFGFRGTNIVQTTRDSLDFTGLKIPYHDIDLSDRKSMSDLYKKIKSFHAGGFVPNFAHIPLLTPLVGRFLTNTISPYSYALSPKLNQLSQLSTKDIFNALVLDKPTPGVEYSLGMGEEGGRVRDFAFRKMFGLKQRTDVSDVLSQNKDKTYSFQKGSGLYNEIRVGHSSGGHGTYKPGPFLGKDHSVMNMFDAFQHQNGDISYKDTWDIGLNAGEKVNYKGAFKSLLNLRHLKTLTNQQEGMYPGVTMDKYSPLSNLLRKSLNAITSPITFAGRTGNGVGYAGGNLNFESSLGKFGITQIRGYLGKQRVGDLEYSEDNEKAKEIEYFGIDKKHQGQGYAKQFYQAMGPGKAHGIILPNFDKQGNVFFPQLSRAAVAKDASIVYHGVFSKLDPQQPRKNYTIDEFKKLISERQKDQKFWKDEGQSFELITNHAKGFVPNFAKPDVKLDKVFSLHPKKGSVKGGNYRETGLSYELQVLSMLPKHGFSDIVHLSDRGSGGNNREADIFARYQGMPWLLDAKYSLPGYDPSGNESTLTSLARKGRTMTALLDRIKQNPALLPNIDPSEIALIQRGVVLSTHPTLPRRIGYRKINLPYERLEAGGFIPNFGIGDDRFNQIGQFLMRGVKKPLPTLSKNDYQDYTSYLGGVSAAQLDKDMKDGYFGGAFDIGRKKTSSLHRLLKKKGFSFSALQNAIGREVSAGYSPEQVLIGESSSLVSSHNPSGVGVYNSTEGSLDRGISLAQQAGVDPSTKGMAGGYVPNFAGVESSWLMGMIQGSVTDLSKRLNFLSVGYDKEIEARRKLAEEYSKAVSQVKAGQSAITPLGTFADEKNLKQAYYSKYREPTPESPRGGKYLFQKRESERETKRYDQYYQEKQASQKKLSDLGFKGMFAGPMIGEGIASVFKTAGMENVSKGFQEFSGGITTASQMLNLFPDKLGKALAVGEIVKSFGNAIAAATSKVGTYEKQLDIQSTILEKLGSASSVMLDSYDKLNQIYNSSTSTMQDFLVQQQRLAKSLMELADVTGGGQLIHDLRGAGTSQQRQTAVTKAMEEAQSLKNIDSVKLEIAQSKQSSWNTASAFSYANDADKINKTQLLRTASYTMQGSALDNLKNKDLNQRLITGSINDQDISIIMGKAADQNKNVLGLNSNDLEQALKELEWQLNQIKMPTNYEGGMEAWTKHLQELFQSTQEEISLRNKYNQELQSALAQGVIISSYNLKQGTQGVESRYREQSLGLAKGAEQVRLKGLTTNDYGMINIEAAQKREEIKAKNQYEQKLNINKGDIEVNTMMSGVIGKALERLKTPNPEGVVNNISVAQQEMSNFLNPKLQNLSRPENAGQLFKMAQNPDTFADKVLGNKTEAITQNSFNQLKTELTTMGRSPDLLAKIADILDKQLNLTSDGKKALDELDVHTQAALKEMNFKDLSNALGGQDILKRGHAREMRRRIVKDEYVMNHSTNAIARGGAAADEASLILPEDRKGPLWDKIKKNMQQGLMSADTFALRGTELGQTQSFQNTQAVAFAQNYGNNKGVEGAPKGKGPENVSLTPGVSELDEAADKAAIDVSAFGKALASLGNLDTLKAFAAQLEAIQNRIASLNPPTTPGTSPKEPVVPPQNFWQRHLPSMTDVTSAVITGAAMGAVGPIAGKLGGLGKRLLGGAKTKVSEMHLPGYQAAKRLLDREGAGTPSQSELNFENSPKPQNTQTGLSPEEEAKYLKDRAKNYRTTPLSKERMQLEIEPGPGPKLQIPKSPNIKPSSTPPSIKIKPGETHVYTPEERLAVANQKYANSLKPTTQPQGVPEIPEFSSPTSILERGIMAPGAEPKLEIPKPSLTSKFADMGENFGKSMIPGVSEAKGLDMLKLTEGAKMSGLFTAVTGLVDIGSTVAGGLSAKGHGSINDILGDEMALQQQSYGGTGQHPILGKTLGNTLDYVGTMFSPQDWAMRIAQWTSPKGKSLSDAQDMSVQNNVAEQQARASYIQKQIQSLGGHVKINELMGQGNYRDIFNPEWQKAHGLTTEEKPATPQTSTEAPKNEAKLLPDTIKIENATMTIVLDLSKARQQIQGMITASLDRIGKSNPPQVATAYMV